MTEISAHLDFLCGQRHLRGRHRGHLRGQLASEYGLLLRLWLGSKTAESAPPKHAAPRLRLTKEGGCLQRSGWFRWLMLTVPLKRVSLSNRLSANLLLFLQKRIRCSGGHS